MHTHTQYKLATEQISETREVLGPRLVQEAEFQLYGNIESLDSVELPHSSRSTLVLSFRDAKVCCKEQLKCLILTPKKRIFGDMCPLANVYLRLVNCMLKLKISAHI